MAAAPQWAGLHAAPITMAQYRLLVDESLPPHLDKCVFPPDLLEAVVAETDVPHPWVFSLSGVHVGVKQFTAPPLTVLVPLDVAAAVAQDTVTVELARLPKATLLTVVPAQLYAHVTNWKYYLEAFLSTHYTTLSVGQTFAYADPATGSEVVLTVKSANAQTVVVVDTDLTLDVAPLNDTMAAQLKQSVLASAEIVDVAGPATFTERLEPFRTAALLKTYRIDPAFAATVRVSCAGDMANVDLVAGPDRFLSLDTFVWSTMLQDAESEKAITVGGGPGETYVTAFAWDSPVTVALTFALPETQPPAPASACLNCGQPVAPDKLVLHEAFCKRNNVRCTCGLVFPAKVPPTHWHCALCGSHGNSLLAQYKHNQIFHAGPYRCDRCGSDTAYELLLALALQHRATVCPKKLHECRFCHLAVPQETATPEDRFLGLTHHESDCGNKTTECYECGKVLRTKDVASHVLIHTLDKARRNHDVVAVCANENCVALLRPGSAMGLCATCYGPLYVSVLDPSHAKLQARLERRYVLQLTKGCGNSWCANVECATGNKALPLKEALAHVTAALLPQVVDPVLPIHTTSPVANSNKFWFCVGQSMQKQRHDAASLLAEGRYARTMVYRAVASGAEDPRGWLATHAVPLDQS